MLASKAASKGYRGESVSKRPQVLAWGPYPKLSSCKQLKALNPRYPLLTALLASDTQRAAELAKRASKGSDWLTEI